MSFAENVEEERKKERTQRVSSTLRRETDRRWTAKQVSWCSHLHGSTSGLSQTAAMGVWEPLSVRLSWSCPFIRIFISNAPNMEFAISFSKYRRVRMCFFPLNIPLKRRSFFKNINNEDMARIICNPKCSFMLCLMSETSEGKKKWWFYTTCSPSCLKFQFLFPRIFPSPLYFSLIFYLGDL